MRKMRKSEIKHRKKKADFSQNSKKKSKSEKGFQSIERAISILRAVAMRNGQGIRLSELAREVGLSITTVHRMLSALNKERFVSYNTTSKLYNLGIDLYYLGSASKRFFIIDKYHGVLKKIADWTGDTAYLFIHTENDSLCLDRFEGEYPIKVLTIEPGNSRPLGIGGGGLALLAFLPDDQVEDITSSNKQRYSDYNRTVEDIKKLVAMARKLGFALSDGAMHPEVRAVGVPIFNHKREVVCSISVGALNHRLNRDRCLEIVKFIKSEIAKGSSNEIKSLL
jgi:DNA-binding IclR family transcriptional regulator